MDDKKLPWDPYPEAFRFVEQTQGLRLSFKIPGPSYQQLELPPGIQVEKKSAENSSAGLVEVSLPNLSPGLKPVLVLARLLWEGQEHPLQEAFQQRFGSVADLTQFASQEIYDEWLNLLVRARILPDDPVYRSILEVRELGEVRYILSEQQELGCKPELAYETLLWLTPWQNQGGYTAFKNLQKMLQAQLGAFVKFFQFSERAPGGKCDQPWLSIGQFYDFGGILSDFLQAHCNAQALSLNKQEIMALTIPLHNKSTRRCWPGVYFKRLTPVCELPIALLKILWTYRRNLQEANFYAVLVERLANSMNIREVALRKLLIAQFKPHIIQEWISLDIASWAEVMSWWLGGTLGEAISSLLHYLDSVLVDQERNLLVNLSRYIIINADRKRWSHISELVLQYLAAQDLRWFAKPAQQNRLIKLLRYEELAEHFMLLPLHNPYQFCQDVNPWFEQDADDPPLERLADWECILIAVMPKLPPMVLQPVDDLAAAQASAPLPFLLIGYGRLAKGKKDRWHLLPAVKGITKFRFCLPALLEPLFQRMLAQKAPFWRFMYSLPLSAQELKEVADFMARCENQAHCWQAWEQMGKLCRVLLKLRSGAYLESTPARTFFYRVASQPQAPQELLPAVKRDQQELLPAIAGKTITIPDWFPTPLQEALLKKFGDYVSTRRLQDPEELQPLFQAHPFHLHYWTLHVKRLISQSSLSAEELKELIAPQLLEPLFAHISGIVDFHGLLKAILALAPLEENKAALGAFFFRRWERLLASQTSIAALAQIDLYDRLYSDICDLLDLRRDKQPQVELIRLALPENESTDLYCRILPSGYAPAGEQPASLFVLLMLSPLLETLLRPLKIDTDLGQYLVKWVREAWANGRRRGPLDFAELSLPREILRAIQQNWCHIEEEQRSVAREVLNRVFQIKIHQPQNFEQAHNPKHFDEEVTLEPTSGLASAPGYSFVYDLALSQPRIIQGINELRGKVVKCFPPNPFTSWLFKHDLLSSFSGQNTATPEDAKLVQRWFQQAHPTPEVMREVLTSLFSLGEQGTPLVELSFEALQQADNLLAILQDQQLTLKPDPQLTQQGRFFAISAEGYVAPIIFSGGITLARGQVTVKVEPQLFQLIESDKEKNSSVFIKLMQNIDHLASLLKNNVPQPAKRLAFLQHLQEIGLCQDKFRFVGTVDSSQEQSFFETQVEFGRQPGVEVIQQAVVWSTEEGNEEVIIKGIVKFSYPESYARFIKDLGLSDSLKKAMLAGISGPDLWWHLLQQVEEHKINYVLESSWMQKEVLKAQKKRFPFDDVTEMLAFIDSLQNEIQRNFIQQDDISEAVLELVCTYQGIKSILTPQDSFDPARLIPPAQAFQVRVVYPPYVEKFAKTFSEETNTELSALMHTFQSKVIEQFVTRARTSLGKYPLFVALLRAFNHHWKITTQTIREQTVVDIQEYQRVSRMAKKIASKISWILPWTYLSDGKFSGIPVHFEPTERELRTSSTSPSGGKLDLLPMAFQMKPVPSQTVPSQITYEVFRFSYGAR